MPRWTQSQVNRYKKNQKSKMPNKSITSESSLQIQVVEYIRKQYPEVVIRSNPLAEFNIRGVANHVAANIKKQAERKGYTNGASDLILFSTKGVLAIELKIPEKDPFRISKGGYWIETNKSRSFDDHTEEGKHVLKQAYELHRICKAGGVGMFITTFKDAQKVIDHWMNNAKMDFIEPYFFSYGWEPDCAIFKLMDKN